MPIPLCTPVISRFDGMNASVTSPGIIPGYSCSSSFFGGMLIRTILLSPSSSEKLAKEKTFPGTKYFHPRIRLAALASDKIIEPGSSGSSCLRVYSWQWSGLFCEIRITFGGGMI